MNKKIILGLPAVYGLGNLIKNNLQILGFEVIDLSFDYKGFKYKNFKQRLINFIRKTLFNDKSYKDKLRFAAQKNHLDEKLGLIKEKADYAIIIRPDTYTIDVLTQIKSKSNYLIGYQWDGMERFPWVEKCISIFDRFFVFDPSDIHYHNLDLPFIGNFYFTIPELLATHHSTATGAYFVGAFNRDRKEILEHLSPLLISAGIPTKFFLYSKKPRKAEVDNKHFLLTQKISTYEENIEEVKASKIIVDITVCAHKGLSLRFYEALCFEKKIITNNDSIKYYDFYHPDNIFIYGQDEIDTLTTFINTPYKTIDPIIKEKYSFENWIRFALNIPPFHPITAPTSLEQSLIS